MINDSTAVGVVNENVWQNRTNTHVDEIAVLAHSSKLLTKRWRANGEIAAYDKAQHFAHRVARVDGIESLAALLTEQAGRPRECLIRGRYLGDAVQLERNPDDFERNLVLRRKSCFVDQPMHAMLVDIDGFVPFEWDSVTDPRECIDQFIAEGNLPPAFANASYYWQLSSSAGHIKHAGVLKAHVWFWLRAPVTSAALRAWFAAHPEYSADKSLFDEIQVHYTADPVFEDGVTDPVPVRHGFVRKDVHAVAIDVADVPVSDKPARQQVLANAAANDPVAQALNRAGMLKGGSTGEGLHIVCPFEEEHTSVGSDSSTVYYPAHTGGYERGHFKCLHGHCAGRTEAAYRDKLGMPHEAEGDFDVHGEEDDTDAPVNSFQLASMRAREPVAPDLIKGVIPDAEFGIIYGKSGSGKSFAAIDLGYHLAQGAPWRGRKVKQRNVFYVAAEGAGGVRKRTQAYSEHHGLDASVPFFTRERGVNLYEKNGWTQAAADILAHTGEAPGVIFVDTLSRSIPGVDENSAKDMSLVIENCQKLGRATGCMVVVIAHAGKNDDQGVRGSSALRAAADFEIAVTRHLETQWRCLKLTKSKDDVDGTEFSFTLASVEVGEDTDGEPVFSAVAVPSDAPKPAVVKKPQGARRRRVFDAFLDLIDFDEGGEVSVESVIDRTLELNPDESKNARCNLRDTIREMCKGETAFFREITPGVISSIPQNSSDAF